MPTAAVTLNPTQYVQVNTGLGPIVLQALRDSVRIVLSDTQPDASAEAFHELAGKDAPLKFDSPDTNIWARSITDRTSLIVSETRPSPTGMISDANSTATLLTNGSSFTGEWEDVSTFDSVVVAAKTDQNGTFSIQFSPDGVNVDSTLTRYYRTNQIEAPHRFTITRKYCRVVFTNDSGSDQTYLRLQTSYGSYPELNAPTDSTLAQDFDATVVRPTKFNYEVGLGRRQGYTLWNKWGYNDDVDVGTETVWSPGGTFARMTAAATLSVVSTSTDDDGDPAGTGAQTLIIWGIDENWEEQIEVITMNGTTPVITTGTWLGVNRMSVYACGTGLINAGTITATATGGGSTVQAQIPVGEGSTQQAIFFSYVDHQVIMDWMMLNAVKTGGGGNPLLTFKLWVTSFVSNSRYEVFRYALDTQREGHLEMSPSQPFIVGEKSIIELQVTSDTANAAASARFSLQHVRDVNG